MTDSERKLWSGLRGEQLGVMFRRQHPVGNFIADFACLTPPLIVELDGSQHADNVGYDKRRDEFLKAQGFAVLRFATDAPLRNLAGVLTVIFDQLKLLAGDAPIPAFPQRGKEQVASVLGVAQKHEEAKALGLNSFSPSSSGGRLGWGQAS